jgi:6-phosphogluconate dehydrogenase
MELGLVGLGKMGNNMRERMRHAGLTVVGYDRNPDVSDSTSMQDMISKLTGSPRIVWVMLPIQVVDPVITELRDLLSPGDIVIDGGNTKWTEDDKHAKVLADKGIHFLDCGVSGGVWGLQNGYALMVGGDDADVAAAMPIFDALKPDGEYGFVHAGKVGAGHFVKMVHNGIEYGLMAAYAEGLSILRHANVGRQSQVHDAETTPLRNPEHYQYELNVGEITELWRRGSVVSSWLLDLTAQALLQDPQLGHFGGRVADSGEGRWTIQAAIDEAVPAPVLTTALYERFSSRGEADFQNKLVSAMRFEFGGHIEKGAQ